MISVPSETHGATVATDGLPLWAWASPFLGRPCRPAGSLRMAWANAKGQQGVVESPFSGPHCVHTVVPAARHEPLAQRASTPRRGTWQPSERLFDRTHRFGMVVTCTLVQKEKRHADRCTCTALAAAAKESVNCSAEQMQLAGLAVRTQCTHLHP